MRGELAPQETLKYTLKEAGTTCNMVTWSSSDSSVAAVDSNGQVTAKKAGKVTISCISAYDKSIKADISIYAHNNARNNQKLWYKMTAIYKLTDSSYNETVCICGFL